MAQDWDAVIIGGGAAGLSAAQMLGRARRRTLVLDAGAPRNRFAAHMHGVLGHDGRSPAELLELGRGEATTYGVEFREATVTTISDEASAMRITCEDGTELTARTVIIASGLADELPEIPGLADEWGHRVLHCPYCHGWEVADQRLAVLATSPMSMHQAQLVRQLSGDVTVFTAAAGALDDDTLGALTARGIRRVTASVREVVPRDSGLTVVTDDGADYEVDAIFTGGAPALHLGFADALGLARADLPGAPLATDATGATSHPRVFAAGNAVAPFANVPVSMGSGSMAGAGANARLTEEDVTLAVATRTAERNAGWEQRYADEDRVWSGNVNATVASIVSDLTPGTALDVGSGEGGDVVWLAERGWRATGVDVSPTAVRRAEALAAERGVDARFVDGDGPASVDGEFDLVVASFLHSWEHDFPRIRLLRDAARRVAPGGRLLVVSHAAPPPWARELPAHLPEFRTPAEELALLDLDEWDVEIAEIRQRTRTAPDGTAAHLDDGVLLLRRAE